MSAPTREQVQRYERMNPKGFLMRVYRNMWSRVTGVQKREARFYEGLPILPLTVFYCWALGDQSAFWLLWRIWQTSGRDRRLTPSIDRRDATKGYVLSNMQWLTQAENSGKVRSELRHLKRPQYSGENHWRAKRRAREAATE